MKLYSVIIVTAIVGLNLTSVAQPGQAEGSVPRVLKVGNQAPLIKVEKWIKGQQIKSFNPGHVYVIEFGATWCGPCKEAIPHLSELAQKYIDKASVIGVFVWENLGTDSLSTEYIGKVERYVQKFGDKIAYNVAVDDPKQTMGETWLKAAKKNGLPTTFLIDQNGKIAWIGGGIEIAKLEIYVNELINETFDATSALQEQRNWTKSFSQLHNLIEVGDYASALLKVDALIKIYPDYKILFKKKFEVLRAIDEDKGHAFGWEVLNKELLVSSTDIYVLYDLASSILHDSKYKIPDYDLAIALSEQIIKYDDKEYYKARAYKNISEALFMKGDPVNGEAAMKKALKHIPMDEYYGKNKKLFLEEMERFRNEYKK